MGALLSPHKPPETGVVSGPAARTPLSDFTAVLGHNNDECARFELRFLDCIEAHGDIIGEQKCKFLFQDLQECTHAWKQMKRVELMRNERDRQGLTRLMKGEKGKWFADPPKLDSYAPEPPSME